MSEKGFNFRIPKKFNLATDCIDKWIDNKEISKKIAIYEVSQNLKINSISYCTLYKKINFYSNFLLKEGIKKGNKVLIRLENSIDFVIFFLSIVKIGAVAIPTSILLKKRELKYIITNSKPRAAISKTLINFFNEEKVKVLKPIKINNKSSHKYLVKNKKTLANDPCYMTYTSGTTGRPKGVLHAHRSIIGREPSTKFWLNLKQEDIVFNPGKLNWTYTLGAGCLDCLRYGSTVVIYSGNHNINNYLEIINNLKITIFMSVPGVYRQILREITADLRKIKKLIRVKNFLCAGEHLKKEIIIEWKKKLNKYIYEGLGMSEISYFISNNPMKKIVPGSCGKVQPGHNAFLVDNKYNKISNNSVGELVVDATDPGLMIKYWRDPWETKKKFKNNLFLTGDIFRLDNRGYLWFQSRKDEIINVLGFRISPKEIEEIVDSINFVDESALCIKKINNQKEITSLRVVLKKNRIKNPIKIINKMINSELAEYKRPKEIKIVSKIEKTINGKVIRLLKN
tara:strand:+ start:1111 stop:2643 length:1533 start_codon:yes stop_codon:yes gene_type:complete